MKPLNSRILSLFLFTVIALLPLKASAQTVVNRARIGGYAEDIAFVTSGSLKDQVVMIDGNELYSATLGKKGALSKVCKLDHPELDQFINGFTFVESEGLFVMNNDPHPNKLYFFDQACGFKGTRPIQYLNSNYRPAHIEGMAYIPASAPVFPDHLILVAWDDLNVSAMRLVIMRRDGVQVAEIGFTGIPSSPDQVFERRRLRVISRAGTLARTIDFSATGTSAVRGVEYFEDAQAAGRLMILDGLGRVFITDLDGNSRNANGFLFGEFNLRVKLGLIGRNDVTAITSGPLAGAFAVTDSSGGEVVIFRLDN